MAAKSKPIDTVTLGDLGLGAPNFGQHITSVENAEARAAGEVVVDDGEGAQRLLTYLEQLKLA
jgi:electron transfer flavoprotein beta subunit